MRCARLLGLGLGLAILRGSAWAAPPREGLVLLRLANLASAGESARVGFAIDLEGPPLVDELPAGALTSLLPGPAEQKLSAPGSAFARATRSATHACRPGLKSRTRSSLMKSLGRAGSGGS